MTTNPTNDILQHLRRTELLRDGDKQGDAKLLGSFIFSRDQVALDLLVRRHGPMVWGVCRRILGNHHDAEDAFQATFLVLVRKAASIRSPELLANWLYGVALQTARKARQRAAKRQAREKQATTMPEAQVGPQEQGPWSDLGPLLDEELSRLPDKYRIAIVLCDVQGKSRPGAARQCGLPEGTVASRLARARALLAKRLARRGVAVSAATLAAVLPQQAAAAPVPAALLSSTIKGLGLLTAGEAAAAGVISTEAFVLSKGVLKAMLFTKLKTTVGVLLLAGAVLLGGLSSYHLPAAPQAQPEELPPRDRPDAAGPASKEEAQAVNRAIQLDAGGGVQSVALSPDGRTLLASTMKVLGDIKAPVPGQPTKVLTRIHILDVNTGKKLRAIDLHEDQSHSLIVTPDGNRLLGSTYAPRHKTNQTVRLWDLPTGKEIRRFSGPAELIYGIALSPDGKTLAGSSGGFGKEGQQLPGEVWLWDLATGQVLGKLKGHTTMAIRVVFAPDGTTIASGSHDQTVRLWDVRSRKEIRKLDHGDVVEGLAISPDGKQLASIGHDRRKRLVLWEIASGRALHELPGGRCVAFSPDGRLLASGGDDMLVHLWEVATGKEVATFKGHTNSVNSAVFSPDGNLLVTAGAGDDTVRLWAVPRGSRQ